MKIAICDDNQVSLEHINSLVNSYYSTKTHSASVIAHPMFTVTPFTPEQLSDYLQSQPCDFDIFILDILMNDFNGIDFGKQINVLNPTSTIIYTSSYPEQAEHLYETSHIYFILKDHLETLLPKALEKAEAIITSRTSRSFIALKGENVTFQINIHDIIYFEVTGHKVHTYTKQGEYLSTSTLSHLADTLPDCFLRVHNSFLINCEYIHAVYANRIDLFHNITVPLSRTYKKSFQDGYTLYLAQFL